MCEIKLYSIYTYNILTYACYINLLLLKANLMFRLSMCIIVFWYKIQIVVDKFTLYNNGNIYVDNE